MPLRYESILRFALMVLLVMGCWLVLQPFFSAVLFAAVIAVSTWPVYANLLRGLGRWPVAAATLACILVTALILGPVTLLAMSVGDAVSWLISVYDDWAQGGMPPPPDWLARIPLLGDWLSSWWRQTGSGTSAGSGAASYFAGSARTFMLNFGRAAGNGLMQIMLSLVVLYFFYRNGETLATRVRTLVIRIGGSMGPELLDTARHTVVTVVIAIAGTAMAQAAVAVLGFSLAGVPHPLLLGAATFVLSMVPIGPPLIWGGAALWLFRGGEPGWALFMFLYGLLCISTVDNVIKPMLISRGAHLPFVVTLLGVLGGLAAFGLIGLFLGPTILALALNLATHWIAAAGSGRPLPGKQA